MITTQQKLLELVRVLYTQGLQSSLQKVSKHTDNMLMSDEFIHILKGFLQLL